MTRRTSQGPPWLPIGLVAAAVLLSGTALLFWPDSSRAQPAPLPPDALVGFQTTDKLVLVVNAPGQKNKGPIVPLTLELVDAKGKVLDKVERTIRPQPTPTSHRFELKPSKLAADQLTLRCLYHDQKIETPLSKVLLVKAHETSVAANKEFFSGSKATLQCSVQGVRSLSETIPLPDADIEIQLTDGKGKSHKLFTGKAGADGSASIEVKVPEVPEGDYQLEIATKSHFGEEKLSQPVKVKQAPRILLVTDKPMYQPGQVMHLRALALQSFNLSAVQNQEITFEVEDSKGNKVFKRKLKTSKYGIAATDFQLASEVNQGAYQLRAILGKHQADKTVTVKPYVLPRFKTNLKADKRFYLPKETVKADLQVDYFFGKPVAGGTVEVKAYTFDVAFKEFHTWKGKTDDQGHADFEIKLPDYFVGQPLQKGDALVRLEVKVIDTADHSETINKTYPVSDQPVKVSLIPEGGKLIPEMKNRVFAAAIYPDGSPAVCDVDLWIGAKKEDKPFASLKTNAAGLAEFEITPKAEQFRQGPGAQRKIEMLGGNTQQIWTQTSLLDLYAEAKDAKGNQASTVVNLSSEPLGENVLLRLNKAIFQGGESLDVDVRTSAGLPTVYVDVIRGGQTVLTKWLDVKDGAASQKLDLPGSIFGSLEVHAYQMLASGEIIRDSRVVYVNPASELKIDIQADKKVYRPGQSGKIRFEVTDSKGKGTPAALGVIIVDEAVYALQEMQPGLEKVYFTLQEELLKPQAQLVYKPSERIDDLVREPVLPAEKQQIAEVLLTSIQPKIPQRWEIRPEVQRRQQMQAKLQAIGGALYNYAWNTQSLVLDEKSGKLTFQPGILEKIAKNYGWNDAFFRDPVGNKLTLESIAKLEKDFAPDQLAIAVTQQRLQQVYWHVVSFMNGQRNKLFVDGKWTFPENALEQALRNAKNVAWTKDVWGNAFRVVKKENAANPLRQPHFVDRQLVSMGPDGKLGTKDDLTVSTPHHWARANLWWLEDEEAGRDFRTATWTRQRRGQMFRGRFGGFAEKAKKDGGDFELDFAKDELKAVRKSKSKPGAKQQKGGGGAPLRIREYFPETMLWQPALVTDEKGIATLNLDFADSITTWRLTASASSEGGLLGGTTAPLRVFQDFFVELDLPLNLTQNDEVEFPLAVYNYLKTPQTVKLELTNDAWFELVDGGGFTRSLDLKPGEVTAVKFRIRAKKIGHFPLTVKAFGSKMSDAVRRVIEVVPDGKKMEQVATDRLQGTINETLTIPDDAVPDASKLFVKIYPGVMSQVLEGTEGMLRLPGG